MRRLRDVEQRHIRPAVLGRAFQRGGQDAALVGGGVEHRLSSFTLDWGKPRTNQPAAGNPG
jgi:hypothetical protein